MVLTERDVIAALGQAQGGFRLPKFLRGNVADTLRASISNLGKQAAAKLVSHVANAAAAQPDSPALQVAAHLANALGSKLTPQAGALLGGCTCGELMGGATMGGATMGGATMGGATMGGAHRFDLGWAIRNASRKERRRRQEERERERAAGGAIMGGRRGRDILAVNVDPMSTGGAIMGGRRGRDILAVNVDPMATGGAIMGGAFLGGGDDLGYGGGLFSSALSKAKGLLGSTVKGLAKKAATAAAEHLAKQALGSPLSSALDTVAAVANKFGAKLTPLAGSALGGRRNRDIFFDEAVLMQPDAGLEADDEADDEGDGGAIMGGAIMGGNSLLKDARLAWLRARNECKKRAKAAGMIVDCDRDPSVRAAKRVYDEIRQEMKRRPAKSSARRTAPRSLRLAPTLISSVREGPTKEEILERLRPTGHYIHDMTDWRTASARAPSHVVYDPHAVQKKTAAASVAHAAPATVSLASFAGHPTTAPAPPVASTTLSPPHARPASPAPIGAPVATPSPPPLTAPTPSAPAAPPKSGILGEIVKGITLRSAASTARKTLDPAELAARAAAAEARAAAGPTKFAPVDTRLKNPKRDLTDDEKAFVAHGKKLVHGAQHAADPHLKGAYTKVLQHAHNTGEHQRHAKAIENEDWDESTKSYYTVGRAHHAAHQHAHDNGHSSLGAFTSVEAHIAGVDHELVPDLSPAGVAALNTAKSHKDVVRSDLFELPSASAAAAPAAAASGPPPPPPLPADGTGASRRRRAAPKNAARARPIQVAMLLQRPDNLARFR